MIANPDDGLITATAVSTRDATGSLRLLAEVVPHLPAGLMLTGPVGLAAAVSPVRPVSWSGRHVKYEWVDRAALDGSDLPSFDPRLRALDDADVVSLEELYATEPGAAFFLPSTLSDRSFVGVADPDGRLSAAAGTHVLSERRRLAALGSVFVRPDRRGRGLGRLVSAGTLVRVADRCDLVGLNVAADNAPARAIYESLGFRSVLDYDEVVLG